jgi:hypothetical protein
MSELGTVTMEGVKLIFRNFRGEEGQWNKPGDRNFCVLLDPKIARTLIEDGWNVKFLKPRDEEEEENPQAYLPVEVAYDRGRPPKIFLITANGTKMRELEEREVSDLDWIMQDQIQNVDMMVRPYDWSQPSGKSGTKAYLQSMYMAIEEDKLAQKYSELERQ